MWIDHCWPEVPPDVTDFDHLWTIEEFLDSLFISDTVGFLLSVPEKIILDRMGLFGTGPCFFLLHLTQLF